jgi:hypothetical protein
MANFSAKNESHIFAEFAIFVKINSNSNDNQNRGGSRTNNQYNGKRSKSYEAD